MLKKGEFNLVYYWAFLIFIVGLLDLGLLIIFFANSCSLPVFLGFSIVSYLAILFIDKTFIKNDYGIPLYIVMFLPGIGGLVVAALYACRLYFLQDNMILADYQRYITSCNEFSFQGQIDYEREIGVLSFLDQINFFDTERKKELIIEMGSEESNKKAHLLQTGLTNSDHEVTHYCAVTLNSLENEYVNLIYHLREEYNQTKNVKVLVKLATALKGYINSGLLAGDSLQRNISKEYSDVLLRLKSEKKKSSYEIDRELIEAYIMTGELSKAKDLNDVTIQEYPDEFEGFFNSLRIAYHSNDLDCLRKSIMTIRSKQAPQVYKDQVMFWVGKET